MLYEITVESFDFEVVLLLYKGKNDTLYKDRKLQTLPYPRAHTFITHLWECFPCPETSLAWAVFFSFPTTWVSIELFYKPSKIIHSYTRDYLKAGIFKSSYVKTILTSLLVNKGCVNCFES